MLPGWALWARFDVVKPVDVLDQSRRVYGMPVEVELGAFEIPMTTQTATRGILVVDQSYPRMVDFDGERCVIGPAYPDAVPLRGVVRDPLRRVDAVVACGSAGVVGAGGHFEVAMSEGCDAVTALDIDRATGAFRLASYPASNRPLLVPMTFGRIPVALAVKGGQWVVVDGGETTLHSGDSVRSVDGEPTAIHQLDEFYAVFGHPDDTPYVFEVVRQDGVVESVEVPAMPTRLTGGEDPLQ